MPVHVLRVDRCKGGSRASCDPRQASRDGLEAMKSDPFPRRAGYSVDEMWYHHVLVLLEQVVDVEHQCFLDVLWSLKLGICKVSKSVFKSF